MPNPLSRLTSWLGRKSLVPYAGSVTPVYADNQPVWSDWSTEQAVRVGYKASGVVYTAVSRIGEALSSVPLRVYRRTGDDWEPLAEHPLQSLLDRPNDFMDAATLVRYASDHLLLGGNALWAKSRRPDGTILELWPLMPDEVRPVRSQRLFISHYERYSGGLRQPDLDPRDLVHAKLPDPGNLYWGLSVLAAAAKAVDTDAAAVSHNLATLQNRAMVPAIVGVENTLEDTALARLKAQLDRRRLGGSEVGKEVFVDGVGRISVHRLGLTTQELDFIASRKLTREEILSIFGVPPPVAGFYDQATYNNVGSAYRIFWETRVVTLARLLEGALNRQLVGDYEPGLWLGFDFSGVEALRESFGDKVKNAAVLRKAGFSLAAVNRRLELDFTDEELGAVVLAEKSLGVRLAERVRSSMTEEAFMAATAVLSEQGGVDSKTAAGILLEALHALP